MNNFLMTLQWFEMVALGIVFFLALYFVVGGVNVLLSGYIFPAIKLGEKIDQRSVAVGQVAREIRWSLVSILINKGKPPALPG